MCDQVCDQVLRERSCSVKGATQPSIVILSEDMASTNVATYRKKLLAYYRPIQSLLI